MGSAVMNHGLYFINATEIHYHLCGLVSEFLATDPQVRVRFPALPSLLRNSGSGTDPLSLVSTIEKLLGRKSSGSGLVK
jgi:hypothetical protein